MSELTRIERAVVQMLAKPLRIPAPWADVSVMLEQARRHRTTPLRIPAPWADVSALFVLRASESPEELLQLVYNLVRWDEIAAHMEQHTC